MQQIYIMAELANKFVYATLFPGDYNLHIEGQSFKPTYCKYVKLFQPTFTIFELSSHGQHVYTNF